MLYGRKTGCEQMRNMINQESGFAIITVFAGIVCAGTLLILLAISRGLSEPQVDEPSVENVIEVLESELAVHSASLRMDGLPVTAHNPFDGLLNDPATYVGQLDPAELGNLQPGNWAFCRQNNTVVYRPKDTPAVDEKRLQVYTIRRVNPDDEFSDLTLVALSEHTYSSY